MDVLNSILQEKESKRIGRYSQDIRGRPVKSTFNNGVELKQARKLADIE